MAHRDRPTVLCKICHKPLPCDPAWESGKLIFYVTAAHVCVPQSHAAASVEWPREEINP